MTKNDPYTQAVSEKLIAFWKLHRSFDADMADLARFVGVSRDTVYRWLRRKAPPKPGKALLISKWLDRRDTRPF